MQWSLIFNEQIILCSVKILLKSDPDLRYRKQKRPFYRRQKNR